MFTFPSEMYVSPIGSYVISSYLINGADPNQAATICKRWRRAKKDGREFDIDDLEDIANYFRVPYTTDHIAFVVGKLNAVFSPYIKAEDKIQLLPIREDGFMSTTLRSGKIYPLGEKIE